MNTNFTVAMSVYKNDNPEDFKTAVHSIYDKQTVRPSEIVLVKESPTPSARWSSYLTMNSTTSSSPGSKSGRARLQRTVRT